MKIKKIIKAKQNSIDYADIKKETGDVIKLKENVILLNSTIDNDSATRLISYLISAQKYLDDNTSVEEKKIYLYINSDGGEVLEGLKIMNFIERSKYPVVGIGSGRVASMAVFVLLSCNERYTDYHAYYLLHQIRGGFSGKFDEIRDYVTFQEKIEDEMINYVVEKTDLTYEDVKILFSQESQLNAEEAISYGLVTDYYENNV